MEEEKILVPQAFADVLTSNVQYQIRKIQRSNRDEKSPKMTTFLHVCKKTRKKKSQALEGLMGGPPEKCKKKQAKLLKYPDFYPFGPKRKE